MNRRQAAWNALNWIAGTVLFVLFLAEEITNTRIPESLRKYDIRRSAPEEATVRRAIDGDTIELANDETVRYIGIDAPESVKPGTPVECFAKEAGKRNRELVEGKMVRLERDVSDRDKYGRLLRYVSVGDVFVNAKLVEEGYAKATSFPPDIGRQDLLRSLEREAREKKRGLWNEMTCSETR